MSTTSPTRAFLLLVLAMTLIAAGCGADTSDTADEAAPADTEVTTAADDGTTPAEDTGDETDSTADGTDNTGTEDTGDETDSTDDADTGDETGSTDTDTEQADDQATTDGLDTGLFMDGALATDPTIEDCTLSDGSTSSCYTVTVTGTPVNHETGPFCPTSISDDEDAGGLWLDGEASYTIDGPFFTELAEIYGDDLWDNIYNDDGSINVIDDAESFQVAARPDITEEYYYHCVDGDVTWTNAGTQIEHTVQIPVAPTRTDAATVTFADGAHSTLGVTLNGAMLAGSADMAAILSSYTIAAFDDCGGHINPALGYHVHGTAGCSDVTEAGDGETAPFAYAIDGFLIFGPDEDATDLDECNGHESEELGYHYHANALEENATLTCLTGLTVEGAGAAAGGGGGGRPAGDRPERP